MVIKNTYIYNGLERFTIELVPAIILEEEEEDGLYSRLTSIISDIITPTHLKKEMKRGSQTFLMLMSVFSTLPKPNIMRNQRQELWLKYLHPITSQTFILAKVNHKYNTFEANY